MTKFKLVLAVVVFACLLLVSHVTPTYGSGPGYGSGNLPPDGTYTPGNDGGGGGGGSGSSGSYGNGGGGR